jgi:predicted nucleic acid-binding protein
VITAVDSSVVLDVFGREARFVGPSKDALRLLGQRGPLVACDVVWAETSGWFSSLEEHRDAFDRLGVAFASTGERAAFEAGRAWRAYRDAGGHRGRLVADFLVGAHALVHADALLTRDRGFYRSHFSELRIIDPTEG